MRIAATITALLVVGCYSPTRPEWTDAPEPSDAPTWERCDGCSPVCSGTDPNVAQCVTELGDLCPAECVAQCESATWILFDGECLPGRTSISGCAGRDGCFRPL